MWKITKVNVSRNICYADKERDSTERIYVIFWVLAHTGKLWIFWLKGKEGPIFQKQPWRFVFQSSVTWLKEQPSVKIIMKEGEKKKNTWRTVKVTTANRFSFSCTKKEETQQNNPTPKPNGEQILLFSFLQEKRLGDPFGCVLLDWYPLWGAHICNLFFCLSMMSQRWVYWGPEWCQNGVKESFAKSNACIWNNLKLFTE